MQPVRVSVVIPVRDDAAALQRCLDALARQSVPPLEVIVVDDGSSDDSAQRARAAGAVVVAARVPGIPGASATGYDVATGEVCARLDADCIPGDAWIERVAERFSADPDLAALTGAARFHDGPRALRGVLAVFYLGAYFAAVAPALGHVPLFGSNLAIRRSVWREVGTAVHLGDDLVHDDIDLSMHVGPSRRIRYDGGLRMGISMRPLGDPRAFATRLHRGFHTIVIHWPHDLPWLRWVRRLRSV